QGWHIQYDQVANENYNFIRKAEDLRIFNLDLARLELMMPDEALRDLAERLERSDAELLLARTQERGAEQGLKEYRQHASDLEFEREELQRRIKEMDRQGSDLNKQLVDLER